MRIIAYLHGFTYSLLTNDRPIREGKEKERNSDNHYKCSHLGWCHREQKLGIVSVPSPIPPPLTISPPPQLSPPSHIPIIPYWYWPVHNEYVPGEEGEGEEEGKEGIGGGEEEADGRDS